MAPNGKGAPPKAIPGGSPGLRGSRARADAPKTIGLDPEEARVAIARDRLTRFLVSLQEELGVVMTVEATAFRIDFKVGFGP